MKQIHLYFYDDDVERLKQLRVRYLTEWEKASNKEISVSEVARRIIFEQSNKINPKENKNKDIDYEVRGSP